MLERGQCQSIDPHLLRTARAHLFVSVTFSGIDSRTEWREVKIDLSPQLQLIVFEAVRGGETAADDEGDVCIDDINIEAAGCCP